MSTPQRFQPAIASLYPWRTFFLALLLYVFLSFRDLTVWTKPVWAILAFIAIPGLSAFALGRGGNPGPHVRAAFTSVGWAMGLYTAYHLLRLHSRFGLTGDAGTSMNVFFAGLFVTVVYALGAGAVCAIVGRLWALTGAKRSSENR
jgi:hypothetical protein